MSGSRDAVRLLADRIRSEVPSCVGLSLSPHLAGVTSTGAATDDRVAALDGVQYLGVGPCVDAAIRRVEVEMDDALSEPRWEEYALAAAANGVRSSLSLPVVGGAVNLYAADPQAFAGRQAALRALVDGLDVTGADDPAPPAAAAPRTVYDRDLVETAVGYVAASRQVGIEEGRVLLVEAAARARVEVPVLAKVLLHVAWDADTL